MMQNFRKYMPVIVAALGSNAMLQSSSQASTLFTFSTGQPAGEVDNGTFNIGNEFTVGANALNVTNIGAFAGNFQSAGVTTVTLEANLYDGSDNFISSTLIPIGTAVDAQGFAYVPHVTTLAASTAYVLTDVATDPTGTTAQATPFGFNSSGGSAGTWSDSTFNQNLYAANPTPPNSTPNQHNGGYQEFLGGNLQYTVPEPACLGLLGLGALGLLARRRRA